MSRLIMWNMLSLDGYFEGEKSWDVEWFHPFFNKELEAFSIEQLRSADALLFGRVTYEGMAAYWQKAEGEDAHYMNTLPKVVFSTTLARADWANTRLVKGGVEAEALALKQQGERDLYVFGSGKLCAALLAARLFDEVRLCMMPLVLGRGAGLFGRGLSRVPMKLLEARPLENGCVILRYEPGRG
ncbi:MAG: dihydrofolate reductase family protein [Terracidiphilus sp.]